MLFERSEFIECFGKSDIRPLSQRSALPLATEGTQELFAVFLFASVFFLVTERK